MKKIISKHKNHGIVNIPLDIKPEMVGKWDSSLIVDPKGYFMIKVEKGNIYVGRVNKKNIMTNIIYGKRAEDLYQELIKRKLISRLDNAAYLGKELTRAEYCLKNKKRFIQH